MKFITNHNKTAIVYGDRNISYGDLIEKSLQMATFVSSDKAILYMENRPEFFYTFLGIWQKGGVAIPIDATFNDTEIIYYIENSDSDLIFTSAKNYENTVSACKKIKRDIKIVNIDTLDFENISVDEDCLLAPDPHKCSVMLYTSGTTGNPKGVMLSFDNILLNIEGLREYEMFLPVDKILIVLPMHHIFPLLGGVLAFHFGATVVLVKDLSSQSLMEAFSKYQITIMLGVPRLWDMLHKKIIGQINASKITKTVFHLAEKIPFQGVRKLIFKKIHKKFGGHIKFFVSGGSKLDPKITKDFGTLGFEMITGYGMTETSPMISFTPFHKIRIGSAGKILGGVDVKFENGEILARGRNVMLGYYKNEKATRETIDEEGYIHTGDLGYLKNGYLYITGRRKEMIVLSNGKNINPADIEKFVVNNSNLIEEVVISDINGKLTAVIFPNFGEINKQGITNIKETLKWGVIDKYNSKAHNYAKILDVRLVASELPKTKLGKYRRFMIPKLVANESCEELEDINEPNFSEYISIKKYLQNISKSKIFPSSHIELDLGLDSLDIVELMSYIESEYGVPMDENTIANHSTIQKLSEYIKEHKHSIKKKNIKNLLHTEENIKISNSHSVLFFVKFLLWLPFRTYIRMSVKGVENIPSGSKIFVGNHESYLDPIMFMESLPNKFLKDTYSIAKIKHFKGGFKKMMADKSNVILVDINKNLRHTLTMAGGVLRKGDNILIFPEGARTRNGKLQDFKKTFALLACEFNIPIVPFVIKGAYEAFPPSAKVPRPKKVSIEYLNPIQPEGHTVEEVIKITRDTINDNIRR